MGGLLLLGFVTGIIASFVMRRADAGSDFPSWAPPLGIAGVALVAAAMVYGSWRFFATADEVEVADNLWGSLIGFYAYAILFPGWWALNKLGQAPEPNHWAIFVISMFIAIIVYGYRKWRLR
jgi:hypothetical protein